MRRGRRGGHGVLEFGGSGEDSFVAVVVTKLTGALLFILLLAMVIMALLPKAVDPAGPGPQGNEGDSDRRLAISTPERLPEAIAGRPYTLALAATGATGPLRWAIDEPLPDGLEFDPEAGVIRGVPGLGTPGPVGLTVRVNDGRRSDARRVALVVYRPDGPLTLPSGLEASLAIPRLPWKAWGELGFGFLVLALVHLVGMNGVAAMERRAEGHAEVGSGEAGRPNRSGWRFAAYRMALRLATASSVVALAAWLWANRSEAPMIGGGTPGEIASAHIPEVDTSR